MVGFHVAPEVEADLDRIWLYIARESSSIDIANRVIERISERFWLLGEYPQIGRRRDHDLRHGLSSFPVGEYVILYRLTAGLYRLTAGEVFILHVVPGSRDIEAWVP